MSNKFTPDPAAEPAEEVDMTSPSENSNVWKHLLEDMTIGVSFRMRRVLSEATKGEFTEEEFTRFASAQVDTYRRCLQDAFESKYHNRARRALRLAESMMNAQVRIQKEQQGG